MKKLILVLATGFIAIVANAASFSWAVNGVPAASGSGLASGVGAWCFLSATSKDQTKGTLSVASAVALINAGSYSDLASYRYKAGSVTSGSFSSSALDGGWGAGDTLTAYTIVFDVSTAQVNAGNASKYIVTAEESVTFANATNPRDITFNLSTATWTAIEGGEPTPEPTSGVMLLLGVAGLALRRKRA